MIRALSACVLALLSADAPAADDTEQLDAEFLEYLATLEGDDDDWTLVAQAEEARQAKDAVNRAPDETSARKVPKQADPPAVDER
jgi:hypothetical protein